MFEVDAVHTEEELRRQMQSSSERAASRPAPTATCRLCAPCAQLHDIDILRLVEQHTQPQEGRNDVQVMLARLDLLGKGIDRRAGSDDVDRIVILQQFEARWASPLESRLMLSLTCTSIILHGVGGTGAAVHFVKAQPFAFQYLDILRIVTFVTPVRWRRR